MRTNSPGTVDPLVAGALTQAQVHHLVAVLGSQAAVAEWVGVPARRVGRWPRGQSALEPEQRAAVSALSFVAERAGLVWDRRVVPDWLAGPNDFLGGATPLQVVLRGAVADVLQALEAEAAGVYA